MKPPVTQARPKLVRVVRRDSREPPLEPVRLLHLDDIGNRKGVAVCGPAIGATVIGGTKATDRRRRDKGIATIEGHRGDRH